MKIQFIKKPDEGNRFDITTIEMSFETVSKDDIIEHFEDFLRACGIKLNTLIESEDD